MTHMHNNKKLQGSQRGFVSLVVALTLVLILALLTVGFAQLSRHEQQQALDKQLSVQARYAAESGINDIIQQINKGLLSPPLHPLPINPNKCLAPPDIPSVSVNQPSNISIVCVLVDLGPKSLQFTNVGPGSDRTITFSTSPAPTTLVIHWGSTNPAKNTLASFRPPPSKSFTPQGSWGAAPGVLQFSITPYGGGALATLQRNALIANNFSSYLYPSKSPGAPTSYLYTTNIGNLATNGPILSGGCNPTLPGHSTTYPCSVTITGLDVAATTGPFLVHFLDYYDNSNVSITGTNSGTPGVPITFLNGQVQIDVTGRAQDVVKRIQVRKSLNTNSFGTVSGGGLQLPDFALESQNLCKRLSTAPVITIPPLNPTGTQFIDPANAPAAIGTPCNLL